MSIRFVCPHCYVAQDKPAITEEMLRREERDYITVARCSSCGKSVSVKSIVRGDYDAGVSSVTDIAAMASMLFGAPFGLLISGAVLHGMLLFLFNYDVVTWGRTIVLGYLVPNYYLTVVAIGFCLGLLLVISVLAKGRLREVVLTRDIHK